MIRAVSLNDATAICNIYNYYVLNTTVTFEEKEVTEGELKNRISDITKKYPWIVYEIEGEVIGYAYASAWRVRSAYRYSTELAIYLKNGKSGKGIGSQLYEQLLNLLERQDIHAVIGGIALPNEGCIALHKKFGFEKTAHFKEVGFKFNKWVDVAYWQKIMKHETSG
jgi:L-amino acid N-acyltransferase YncA